MKTVKIIGNFEIRTDNLSKVEVEYKDKTFTPVYYGKGEIAWDLLVPNQVNSFVQKLYLQLDITNSQLFDHLYTKEEKPTGTFCPAY